MDRRWNVLFRMMVDDVVHIMKSSLGRDIRKEEHMDVIFE